MSELPMPGATTSSGPLEDKLGLCLSGGGYRAMVFHLGVLWYLNDAGYLPKLDRVSSVSGGSITAGFLGIRWSQLEKTFDASGRSPQFGNLIVAPIRGMAGTTIDAGSVITGALLPGTSVGQRIVRAYRKALFGEATLQNLPDRPKFFLGATNVQTGALFRFSKKYLADWHIGRVMSPTVGMAEAVAASSAFPPILSPSTLELKHSDWTELKTHDCGVTPFTTKLVLTDAGVYDNLGVEPVWKRCKKLLVSDAGGRYQPEKNPHHDPIRHALRVQATTDNQVRSLRKRQVVGSFESKEREGTYFGLWVDPDAYEVRAPNLKIDKNRAAELANTPTRLARMPNELQNRLINFGYGMAERAIRTYFDEDAFEPKAFPAPGGV